MSAILIEPLEVRTTETEHQLIIKVTEWVGSSRKREATYNIRLPILEVELVEWMKKLHKATTVIWQHTTFLQVNEDQDGREIIGPKYH